MINNKIIQNTLKKTKGYPYLLADSGYDSKNIESILKKSNYKYVIKPNSKNTKYKRKRKLKRDLKKYKKCIIIEHFFGIIKKYPKMNCIYEKKINSYFGLVLFLIGSIIINRINKY